MIKAVRLVSPRYADIAFDGEGARRYGGRWNSKDTSMVYAASSLAALEMLVHRKGRRKPPVLTGGGSRILMERLTRRKRTGRHEGVSPFS